MRGAAGNVFSATDYLVGLGCKRIVLVGTSKGSEAALLTAVYDPRISAVVAMSPSSVVWGNIGPGLDGISWPERSSWTLRGRPLPFVSSDPEWAEASQTARPFFERKGFRVITKQIVEKRGQGLENFLMEKLYQ
nr:hypothetical protein [Rhizobium laguerreae]